MFSLSNELQASDHILPGSIPRFHSPGSSLNFYQMQFTYKRSQEGQQEGKKNLDTMVMVAKNLQSQKGMYHCLFWCDHYLNSYSTMNVIKW